LLNNVLILIYLPVNTYNDKFDGSNTMNQNGTAIAVNGLSKSYKDIKVLKEVDFTVRTRQVFALLGSNGAGKTTMVKILTTLIKPDNGTITICGFDLGKQEQHVRECISLAGQYSAVDDALTGMENLIMIGTLRHLPDKKQQAQQLLDIFGLTSDADRKVQTYSGGMRRKLDLAMSLMGNPSIIFLDEPTTGLDPQSRLSLWKTIKQLVKSGTTIFLTTQYLEEAEYLADYIAILNDGVITAEGTSEELKKIIPGAAIEFEFHEESDLHKAMDLLKDYDVKMNKEIFALSVSMDDDIEQLANILNTLKNNSISVSRFEQKLPTLEDVFLTLVDKN